MIFPKRISDLLLQGSILVTVLLTSCNRCENGCENGICQQSSCNCFEWYEGDACERLILKQYEGAYAGLLSTTGAVLDTFNFELGTVADQPEVMRLEGEGIEVEFEDRTRFSVVEQTWNGRAVNGEGEMLLNRFAMRLNIATDSDLVEASLSAELLR